ncbi:MAG: 2,3-dihydro-2,3-dihydroxybenzoate dehydrogenase [Marinobacterium sp.]|nr:2,3-dihydro-2,3-dihydroxybenzoate dehydrogenase [Marinobacterium sp.]
MSQSPIDASFNGKCVWVTGAAQGIGYRVAESFAALGAQVIGLDCQTHSEGEQHFELVQLDVSRQEQVQAITAQLLQRQCGPDVLVNAAGVLRMGTVADIELADWHTCMNVNVNGVFYLLQALMPHFKARRRGAIVNVGSNAGHVPRLNMAAYCASKAALASLSHCTALELASYGVRCNMVSPGSTDTPMLRNMLGSDEAVMATINGYPDDYKLGIPLGKIGQPQEVANTVLFLASELASHITMQDIVVDGGATLTA